MWLNPTKTESESENRCHNLPRQGVYFLCRRSGMPEVLVISVLRGSRTAAEISDIASGDTLLNYFPALRQYFVTRAFILQVRF